MKVYTQHKRAPGKAPLDDREEDILRLYYQSGRSLADIGSRFGISRQHVNDLRVAALNKINLHVNRKWAIEP